MGTVLRLGGGDGTPYVRPTAAHCHPLKVASSTHSPVSTSARCCLLPSVCLFLPQRCSHIHTLLCCPLSALLLTRAALVMLRSFITSSNAAVSSACFWLCNAIFSLNFRGLFEVAIFPPPPPQDARAPTLDVTSHRERRGGGEPGKARHTAGALPTGSLCPRSGGF